MEEDKKYFRMGLILMLGIFLQFILALAETADSPNKAVTEFVKAYCKYDAKAMNERLGNELVEQGIVSSYLASAEENSRARGLTLSYLSDWLYNVETVYTPPKDDSKGIVHIKCKRKCPLRSFFGGSVNYIDETFEVAFEDQKWKIFGNPFGLVE